MKKNSTITRLATLRKKENEWEREETPDPRQTLSSQMEEQKKEVKKPETTAKAQPFSWLNTQEDSTNFFNDWRKQISDNRKEAEYRYSLSDDERELYDTIKNTEGYSSEYLKDRSGGDYTKKLDLKYENDEWNNLARDQKERYLRLANASTDTDIYESLSDEDKRLYDRISGYEHDDNGRTFMSNDDYERSDRMYREAQNILIGGSYSDEKKRLEQKKMFFSLPDDIREGLIVFSDKGGLFQTSTESPMKDEIIDTLRNKYNYSDDEIDMLFKYGAAVYNAEQQQEYNELIEHEMETNPFYATAIAPFQQAGADIAGGFAAPRTIVNKILNKGSYGVADGYQSYLQNVAGTGEYIGQSVRSSLEERGDALGWLASKSYGLGISLTESAFRGSLARGFAGSMTAINPMSNFESMTKMAMNAMMGSSVVQQSIMELTNNGMSTDQAVQTAIVRGILECLFEDVSLEKIGMFSQTPILKTASLKEFTKNLAKAGFTEGMEEVSTDLANDLYDMLMNYDYSDFEDFAKEHPDWDADTLRGEYIIRKIGDYAGSFLGGAISGLGLGTITGGMAYNNVSNWANQGVSVNDADYARMASVVESVARQDGGVAETLKQMDEEGVDDVIRRGYFKTVVDSIEKNYSQAIDKATDVKQLDNVMENLNRQTNSVISQDIINKYNAKLVEFGKEGKVDYDTFIQNRDSNANTTFSELAFGNGESAIARNIRSDIDTVTEGFNAVAQDSLLQKEALRKAAEAQTRLEENNERVSTIIRNFAALGKDMDSPEVRKYANLIGIENSAKAYSEGKLASEETIKTSKNGSIASMTQEEINAEFGENAAHIVEYGDVIRGKKNYQLAYNIGQAITKMGINVRLYESDRNSKISNGFYKNGTIYLDINAGVSGVRSAIGETFSHELTHWIRANNESGYQSLLDFVKNELGDEFDKQVKMELGKLKNKDNNIAEEEVVANACARMLKNSETFKKYAIADMSGAQRILARLREFVSNMKKAFQGSLGKDGERAADLISDMEGLQKEWEKALNDAIAETTALEAGIDMETYDDSVVRDAIRDTLEEKDKQGKPKGYDSWEDKVSAMLQEKLGIDKATADKYIRDEQSIASMIFDNIGFLYYKPDDRYEAIKKNSDYPQGTVDLTNLCRKRAIFTEIFDSLQEHFPDKLFNAMDIAEIRQVLKDHGYQVACALCFVEDRRQRVGEIADNFIERLKLAKGGALTVVNSKGQTKTLTMTKDLAKQDVSQRAGFKYGDVIKVTDKYIPTQYDLITYDGFKALSQNHPQVASAFIRANNYLGMSSARLVEGRAEYKRQILDYTPAQVKRINNKGGLRIFSFSDFEAVHLLDICQVITDAAAVGLKIQAYTKVPEFAKLVANTGIKLNRSLIPFGVNGYEVLPDGSRKLKYDTTEGIDINHKDFFDSSDNPNIGNILVGINDEHIRLAMLDDFVDYIIPFHTNQGKNVLAVKGISAWTNYKEYQRERYIDGRKGARDVNIYTQVIDKYNPKNKVEFVNAFLKECKAQKKIPRFDQFLKRDANGEYVYTPGYEKLLLDFKMFDKQGNILPQTTVNPNIDMDTAKNILVDEVKNAESRVHVSKQIINELENKYETRHAARDSEGNELSEAQQEYFADSKVRDENGNLKVMRHGSEHAGFTVFNPEFSDDNRSLFFTDDPSVAKTYSGSYEAFSPSKHYSFDDLNKLISNATGGENYIVNDNGTYKLMEAGFIGQEDNVISESTNIDDIRDTFMDEYLSNLEGEGGNYEVYLNITNLLVVDANNSYWDEIEVDWSDELQTTRTLAEKAANEGYDGVIVNNVIDTAIYGTSEEKHRVSNIAIAFNSNQVKDVNNTNPTENEDIRYATRENLKEDIESIVSSNRIIRSDVVLSENTPDILVGLKGVKNLPFVMKPSHIRENILTKEQASALGLPIDDGVNYHGLGVDTFYDAIRDIDDIDLVYRGTPKAEISTRRENYFLLISKHTDKKGNPIVIPVYTNVGGTVNQVIVPTNKAATVFGKDYFNQYIEKELKKGNIVRVKVKKKASSAGIGTGLNTGGYADDSFNKNISQSETDVKRNASRDSDGNELSEEQQEYFKDSKVRDAEGNLMVMWHGTEEEFNTFDISKGRSTMDIQGSFFSPWEIDASGYGSNVRKFYLAINNPANETIAYRALNRFKGQNEAGIKAREYLISQGYDGVINGVDGEIEEVIAFYPNQIKEVDNTNPTASDDIRYSVRDIANSESEMLVNALKNADTTSRYSLEQYAKEYNNLRAMEQESFRLAKELKKASPSQRDVLTKKILRLDRQILKATEKLTEMRTQRVISDILVNEWSKRLADVEWTNELTYQKTKKALEERYGRSLRDLRQKNKEQQQGIRDRYEINKRKKNIEKKTKEIMNRILHPTEKKHIPSILINPIVEMLDGIDYWTPAENRRVTKKSESLRERFMSFREAVNRYQKEIDEGAEMTEYMFDPEFLETVDELCESVKGIDNVNDMNVEDIVKLDQTLTELNHLIARGNKMITASHYATINDAVTDSYDELSKREDVKKAKGNLYQRLNAGMSDAYAFARYAGNGAANIIDMLSKAFEKKITQIKEGKEFAENILKDKDTKSWSKDKIAFKTEGGATIELTVAQMMELYLLNKREQARGHIYGGGINIEDKNGKFRKAVKVTESDVNQVIRYLKNVPGAIEVADALQNFGATVVTGWGNEASNLLYGISKFTDPDYWQIRSDSASLKENAGSEAQAFASMFKLQNLGRTKAVKKNANNALYIGDVFDTFAKTIDEMSSYGSILPATTDAMRWYNSSVAVDENTRVRIKAMLQNKLGTDMARVFTDTIRALNGGVLGTDSLESLVKVMTGRAKAAAVAGNLRVVLQQPTAYTRAFSVIPAKYLLRALTMKPASAEAQENSPIAWSKAQGFYSNGLAPSLRKLIVGDQTIGESITEKALWLAGKADDITWGALWNASKLMVKDTTNLTEGSDAYWKKVNEIFSNIINKTQVVDTPLTKATWMRGNGVGIYFTAFMAEPTKTYSMVSTAVDRVLKHPKSPEARKALAIAGFTFGLNAIVNAFAQAIADAARDDDKEKDYFQKFGEQWKEDVLDNINPLTYVPVVKDAWSALNGYSSSRLDLQAIQNSVYAMNELKKIASGKSTKTLFGQVEQVSKAVSSWTGIPVSNVMRTMNSFGNLMGIDAFRRKQYTNSELARNIALSAEAGNIEDYEKYTNQLTENLEKSGSSKSVDDYLSDYLAKNSEQIDEWAVKYYDDPTTLNDAIADMSEWYSPNVVVKAIKKSINQDATDDDQKVSTSTSAGTVYNSGDINRMLKKGDIQIAQEIIDTIGDGYAEMGSSASPKTQITTYWKPIYQNASLAEKEEIRKMLYKLSYKGKQMYSAKDFDKWK